MVKAENLENTDEALKLRRNLDQQLIGFQDVITKLPQAIGVRDGYFTVDYDMIDITMEVIAAADKREVLENSTRRLQATGSLL